MSDLLAYEDARERRHRRLPADPQPQREHHPRGREALQEQAAAYFMLGETTGTSAGGAAEAGKFLRVPGTNPFFPLPHGLQGNRILELLASHPIETFLLNTGRVGGKDGDDRSKKVKIPHTSACVKGIAEGAITWTDDDDFGYQIAASVPGLRRRRAAPAAPALRARGPRRRVRRDRRAPEGRARGAPAGVPRALRGDHQGRRLARPARS